MHTALPNTLPLTATQYPLNLEIKMSKMVAVMLISLRDLTVHNTNS